MSRKPKNLFIAVFVLMAMGLQAEKKVTFGATTFTVYKALSDLAPIPPCGFVPPVPGYMLKTPNYGPGTYYVYAPGMVPRTDYACILTEIRDWVFYRPDEVRKLAAQKGLKPVDGKTIKKLFKDAHLSKEVLLYQLSDTSWIYFYVGVLQNCGPADWSSHEEHVCVVQYIEHVPPKAEVVLDRLYRFRNDGVRFADNASVTQSNSNTPPSAPTDQNPDNFSIGDVLNPAKGFYRLSFAGGAPTYVWHKCEKVVAANQKKPDFSVSGEIGYDDVLSAFDYGLDAENVGPNLFFRYSVSGRFIVDFLPGRTWQSEMAMLKEMDVQAKASFQQLLKTSGASFEMLYKEIFK